MSPSGAATSGSARSCRRPLCRLAVAAAAALAAAPSHAAPACESPAVVAKLTDAKLSKAIGQYDRTIQIADEVLRASPNSALAKYIKGLALIQQSKGNRDVYRQGLSLLADTADRLPDYDKLPPEQKQCPENERLYTIFNTVGYYYSEDGDRKAAEKYLLRAEKNAAPLSKASLWKLYDNLGLFYANNLDLDKAAKYYERAKMGGSPEASKRLDTIRAIQRLGAPPK